MPADANLNKPAKLDFGTMMIMGILALLFGALTLKEASLPLVVLVAGAMIGGTYILLSGISRPEVVTYFLVVYLPFSKVMAGDFGGMMQAFNLTNALMLMILFVWLTGRYAKDEPLWINSSLNLPIALFILLGFMAVFRGMRFHADFFIAIVQFKRWITPIVLYFLVLNTVKEKYMIRTIIYLMITVTAIVGFMASYDYATMGEVSSLEKARIGGISDHSNTLAAFFNYYMFLPLAFFLMNMHRFSYWGFLIPFLLQVRGVMVTFSRGGYLAMATGLYAIMWYRSKLYFVLLLFATSLVFVFPQVLPSGIRYRMMQTLETQPAYLQSISDIEGNLEASAESRIEIWKGGLAMIKDHPWFGVGYGLFAQTIKYYWSGQSEIDAHNTYLIIGAEMGLPTLFVFLWIIAAIIWKTRQLYYRTEDPFTKTFALGFLGGLFGLLMSNMFGSRLDSQEVSGYFWILCALVMRLHFVEDKEDRIKGRPQKGFGAKGLPIKKITYQNPD